MPTYVFRCPGCGEQFEHMMTVAQREQGPPACPKCGHLKVQPVVSAFFAKTSRKS